MAFDSNGARIRLFDRVPAHFVDPVTGLQPTREEELSAVLAVFHQRGLVAWNRVILYLSNNQPSGMKADGLFTKGGLINCEHPLFAKTDTERKLWGGMKADLLYISQGDQAIALVENKVGSGFTSGRDVETGQLARQAEFLLRSKIPKRYLVVLATEEFFEAGWYLSELRDTLSHKNRSAMIDGFLMRWEEVLASID